MYTYPRAWRPEGARFWTRLVALALFELRAGRLVLALLALGLVLLAFVATAVVAGGAPERVFMAMATTRVIYSMYGKWNDDMEG